MRATFGANYNLQAENSKKQAINLFLYTRPVLSWKLSCEVAGSRRSDLSAAMTTKLEFPDRIFVAGIFAFVCVGIELIACGCGICGNANNHDFKSGTMARACATICSGLFVVNIIWMVNTGASTLRDYREKIDSYSMINDCADDVTNLPIEEIQ